MLLRDDSYFEWIVVYVLMISFCVFVSIQNSPDWDSGVWDYARGKGDNFMFW
jgi:hypothetical protein